MLRNPYFSRVDLIENAIIAIYKAMIPTNITIQRYLNMFLSSPSFAGAFLECKFIISCCRMQFASVKIFTHCSPENKFLITEKSAILTFSFNLFFLNSVGFFSEQHLHSFGSKALQAGPLLCLYIEKSPRQNQLCSSRYHASSSSVSPILCKEQLN